MFVIISLKVVKRRKLRMWNMWGNILCSAVCLCVRAGLPTCSPGTGPVPPSSLWPVTPRQLAKLTCTAASSPCSTLSPPTMCGQRMSTCVSTLPWTWVRRDKLSAERTTGSATVRADYYKSEVKHPSWCCLTKFNTSNKQHFYKLIVNVYFPGKARGFFREGDVVIVLTGWRPGSGYTNTMRVILVPWAANRAVLSSTFIYLS